MSGLKSGDAFPTGVKWKYIPYTKDIAEAKVCGFPVTLDASADFATKKVVIVSLPGAFTPTCSGRHVPGFIEKIPELKAKGVNRLIVLAHNDPFVMSGWQKVNLAADPKDSEEFVIFATDESKLAENIGWLAQGDVSRNGRFALVVDHGKVTYAGFEAEDLQGQTVSTVDAVLKAL